MTLFVGQSSRLSRQHASQAAGFVALAIGATVFIGLWAGLPLLSSWGTGLPHMRPLGALALAVTGFALAHPGKDARLAFAVGLIIAALTALGLVLVLSGIELGVIDFWLAPWADAPGLGTVSFQIASAGTVALGLAAGALALGRFDRHRVAATTLSSIAGAIAAFAVFGYLTGVDTLYGSVLVNSPPLPTAVGLLCIAGGIILRIGTLPAFRKRRPLWKLLVMLGGAIVAPLLLFGAYAGFRLGEAQLHQVRGDLTIVARAVSANVDGEIERLQALAASPSLRQGDFAAFQRQAKASLAMRQSGSIMLIDRNMQQLVNTRVPFGEPLQKVAIPEPVEKALATGKQQVTGLFMDSVINQLVFAIVMAVQINGENRYALVRSPDAGGLVAGNELAPGWQAMISDAAYRIIAGSAQSDALVGRALPPAQQHRTRPGSIFEFIDPEGRPSLEAYAWSGLTGWETTVWAPKALLEAPIRAQWRTLGVTALMASALVLVLASSLGRVIAHSVGEAADAATALGEGRPLPTCGTFVDEVDTLMAELRKAATRRQAAEGLLRDSERELCASKDRLEFALNAAQLGWWQYDPLHRVISGDRRAQEIFNAADGDMPIEDIIAKRLHPDDVQGMWAALQAALDPSDPKPYTTQYRVDRGSGQGSSEVRWVEAHGLAYFEGNGHERRAESIVGTVQDITERKEREEKEHLLMREINHRARNMLSVVDAIAHQTAARNPEDFLERFSRRIQALSANQDLLVRNEWNGVEITDLVRAQLAHFTDVIGHRIILHGPEMRLKPASAQAIGLALHELATNAGKYGALSMDKGRVDISWETNGGTFTMRWIERNGPRISCPERRGFGTVVVDAMAERSLDGTVDLDFPPSGVTWRLTCPAANALEP